MINVEEILSRMNPNQRINYDRVMQQMVKVWQADNTRPKILMHVCCAPCSTYTLEYLTQYADVTIYFANSNIHPKAEYHKRAYVTQKFVSDFNEKTGNYVQYIEAPYEPSEYRKLDYFGSALTISPHKNSQTINSIGIEVQKIYTTHYLPSDFKKNQGYKRSVEMCEEYDIYRQCYCGCVYAAQAQNINLLQIKKDATAFLADKNPEKDYSHIKFTVTHLDR